MNEVRVRFAPSPTGPLHVGGARTALFNYLFSTRENGKFILRIEDTDTRRNVPGAGEGIMDDLRWLGLEWDEGPDRGGEYGPYRQSERLSLYNDMARHLLQKGLAYPCYCSARELEQMRGNLLAWGKVPTYTGKCRKLTTAERKAFEREGRRPALRFLWEEKVIHFKDLIKGESVFDLRDEGDFVIMKSDEFPAYNFAATIDDVLMKITHVLRGEDSYANSPKQIVLARALGFTPPEYGHLPMVLGPDKALLSKRHGAVSIRELREKGYLQEALLNVIARIGWAPQGEKLMSLERFARQFRLEKVSRAPGIFDIRALDSVNSRLLRKKEPSAMREGLRRILIEAGVKEDFLSGEWVDRFYDLVKGNIKNLSEAALYAGIFEKRKFDLPIKVERILKREDVRRCIMELERLIDSKKELSVDDARDALNAVKEKTESQGIIKPFYLAVRVALTGLESGPEMARIMAILGREEVLRRINELKRYFPGYRM